MEPQIITYHIFPVRLEKVKKKAYITQCWQGYKETVDYVVGMTFLGRHLVICSNI